MELRNKYWSEEEFNQVLEEVRGTWPTGMEVDLDEAVRYHKSLPEKRNLAKAMKKAEMEKRVITCPRVGAATVEHTLDVALYVRDKGGADAIGVTPDTYTRKMQLHEAKKAMEESCRLGRSLLNGFPTIIHGLKTTRHVYEAIDLPISSRHGAPTPQLHYLITLAAGATEAIGGGILFTMSVDGVTPLDTGLLNSQFEDRLIGWFQERGVDILKEVQGSVGTLCCPSVMVAGVVIESLLAAEQGVKNIDILYTPNLHITQDVAGMRVQRKLVENYLRRFGYNDVSIVQCANMWMGVMPEDRDRCFAPICLSAAIVGWGGASKIMTKSTEEGFGIATKEAQAAGVKATKEMLSLVQREGFPGEGRDRFDLECHIIEKEAKSMLEKTLEIGDGDIAIGTVRAFRSGILDWPYCANKHSLGKALTIRDSEGAVRWATTGNLPFDKEVTEFNRERVKDRVKKEGKEDYELIIHDLSCALG